jgi:hypothetical protein
MSLDYADKPQTAPTYDLRARSGNGQPSGKLKQVIDLIIYDAIPWRTACNQCDVTFQTFQNATRKPHIVSYMRQRYKAHREALCAANATVTAAIRDDDNVNALVRLKAVALLDHMNADVSNVSVGSQSTGSDQRFTINIVNRLDRAGSAPGPLIEQAPNKSNDISGIGE